LTIISNINTNEPTFNPAINQFNETQRECMMCKNAIYEYYGSHVTRIQELIVSLEDKTYRINGKIAIQIFLKCYISCV